MTNVKIMQLWSGSNFAFHQSQELNLVKEKLMGDEIVSQPEAHGVTRYQSKSRPHFWCRSIPSDAISQGLVPAPKSPFSASVQLLPDNNSFKTLFREFETSEGKFTAEMDAENLHIKFPNGGVLTSPVAGFLTREKKAIFCSDVPELLAAREIYEACNMVHLIRNGGLTFPYSRNVLKQIRTTFLRDRNFHPFAVDSLIGICPECGGRGAVVSLVNPKALHCIKCSWRSSTEDFYPDLFEPKATGAGHAE